MNLDLLNLVITELNQDLKSEEPAEYIAGKLIGAVYYSALSVVANFLAGVADMGASMVQTVLVPDEDVEAGILGYYSKEEEAWKMDVMDANMLTSEVFYDLISSVEMEVEGQQLDKIIITHPLSVSEFCEVCAQSDTIKLKHLSYALKHSEDESLKTHTLHKHT